MLDPMTEARVAFVDVYVLRQAPRPAPPAQPGVEVLVLRRGPAGRSPGSWETVHGTVEPGETPVAAALRELREETGYEPVRLYNASRVEAFYRHRVDQVALGPVFAAFVDPGAAPRVSAEHDRAEWLAPSAAAARLAWPRERRALDDILSILGGGDGGLLDDVLRVC
ncbi:MAG: lipoyltransferase [Gemmatimonadetes bacterium]|nr:MAG: lipoyltransferase [Gemmatimonadota bacterium]